MRLRQVAFSLLALLLLGGLVMAQAVNAKLEGVVSDNEGGPLPGVTVMASSPTMVGTASTVTDENGKYRLLGITPGTYKITFALEGFTTITKENIILHVEETLAVNVKMKLGQLSEEIVVTAQVPLIDTKSTSRGGVLTKQVFSSLPKGRNFESLVSTIPGVNMETGLGGTSVDGASGAENMFYIDGMDTTGLYTGQSSQSASFEMVEEVQVKASGYQAEYGGSMGGVISVVTRSGGNAFHGELIGYYGSSWMQGKERDTLRISPDNDTIAEYVNYQDLYGKDKWDRIEAGFNLGGYILKDRLWFFGTVLPEYFTRKREVNFLISDEFDGEYKFKTKAYNYQMKLTAQPFKDLRLTASFINNWNNERGTLPGRDGAGNPSAPWDKYGYDYPNWTATAAADYVVGNNFIMSLRGGYFRTNTTNQQVALTEPVWRFTEDNTYGGTTNNNYSDIPNEYKRKRSFRSSTLTTTTDKDILTRASGNLDLTYYAHLLGEHAWKAGVQWVQLEEDVDDTMDYPYVFLAWGRTFSNSSLGVENVSGKYGYYSVRGGKDPQGNFYPYGTLANPTSTRWALYIQDSWTPSFLKSRLTLNLGLRTEREDMPSFSDLPQYQYSPIKFGFGDKLAPRLGFVYDVHGDSSLKVYGSFGVFYDVMKLSMASGTFGGLQWTNVYYTLDTYEWDKIGVNGNYPGTYIGSVNWRIPAFDTVDPDLKPMSQTEYTLGLEKKIFDNLSTSVRFVYKHLNRTIEDVGTITPEGELYYITNPGYGYTLPISQGGKFLDIYPTTPKAKRNYVGVTFALDKRFSDNWMAGFSYTWSQLTGNYSGLASSDEIDVNGDGRVSPNTERYYDGWFYNWDQNMNSIEGKLGTDRPHYFKVYGSYSFPFGLTLGLTANAMSGTPISRQFQVNGADGYYPLGRFTDGRTPFLFYTNAYVEYNLKIAGRYSLQLSLNVDNLFNTKTARGVYQIVNQDSPVISDEDILAGWDYTKLDYYADPRFLKEMLYYPPIQARFGVKFTF